MLVSAAASAEGIYSRAFGKPGSKAIVFLHGGPGYNCASFEVTTAQKLADRGFYVIVYDRRGEGRSVDKLAEFTFAQTFADIDSLYRRYGITRASLIGHSFGGVVATLYARSRPQAVDAVVLVGAPVALQETFETIVATSKAIYTAKGDTTNLKYIAALEAMDKASIQYSSFSFMHAMYNKFYQPKAPSAEAKGIYAMFRTDSTLMKYASKMTIEGPQGFWKREQYTTIDLSDTLRGLVANGAKFYGLYGKEDGLYSEAQVARLEVILGKAQVKYLADCSHSVFVDQQETFLDAVKAWCK